MNILIAIDGSNCSKSVMKKACQFIAEPQNTTLRIISAVEPLAPMVAEPFAVSAEYYADFQAAANKQARALLDEAVAELKASCPNLKAVTSDVMRGGAAQTIVEAAGEWNADLIIVGSHGYSFWSRTLLGSVSNAVVHQAPCSILIIRGSKESNEKHI